MKSEYARNDHHEWLNVTFGINLSEFGKTVANIIGFAFGGIYNCPVNHKKVDWNHETYIAMNIKTSVANYDSMILSALWILCHRKMIRFEISGVAPNIISITFHKRTSRDGKLFERLPDCESIIGLIDKCFSIPTKQKTLSSTKIEKKGNKDIKEKMTDHIEEIINKTKNNKKRRIKKIPKKIRMKETVQSNPLMDINIKNEFAETGKIYLANVNKNTVFVITENGQKIKVNPEQYDVVDWKLANNN